VLMGGPHGDTDNDELGKAGVIRQICGSDIVIDRGRTLPSFQLDKLSTFPATIQGTLRLICATSL
jgi:hypothetical protein